METFLKIAGIWLCYFCIHSIFASFYVKKIFKGYFPGLMNYYRAIYNFFATAGLIAIYIYQSGLSPTYLYPTDTGITFLGLGLATAGIMIILESFREYDVGEFLGIRQVTGDLKEQGFVRKGLLKYMRHPLYTGSMLLLTGYLVFAPSTLNLITVGFMILYFIIGSYFEEKKLIRSFGNEYLKYKEEVPAFIPRLRSLISKSRRGKK